MQGPNQVSVNGLFGAVYTPENIGESLYQTPLCFDAEGFLMIELPAGSGQLTRITGPLVTQPANAHAIMTQAYNRVFAAYSDLNISVAPINVYSLQPQASKIGYVDPYGQLPLGATWTAATAYIVGNYVQPTATGGNGHLYRCTQPGTSAGTEPTWPLTENGKVKDGGVAWEELTPWLANRLPAPNTPSITRTTGGTFAAGRDVYLILTVTNAQGESVPSGPAVLVDTILNNAVSVAIPTLASFIGPIRNLTAPYVPTGCKLYEADVATGTAAPSSASFALVGSYGLGAVATVTSSASGAAPPTANTARVTPGGLAPASAPVVERASGAGTFPAGRDVYVIATLTNSLGETLPSVAGSLLNTVLNDAVQVPIPSTLYQITGVNLYECDVVTGAPAPNATSYALVGTYQPNTTATISASASGPPPPASNTSGTAGNIAPDDGTGLRYASIAFTNRNGNLSGTVPAFTSIFVDVPGYELYMANIPIGPSNIINRTIGFTVADGTNVGPFFYIPSATVSANIPMTATVIPDNTSTTAFFNFTDEFLEASTDMTDRLRVIQPPAAVDVYYSPSIDRIVLSGVNGYGSGHYISLAADSESYYGDTSPIQVANGNGQLCICAREFQGTLYSLKERSGFTISPLATDPSTWSVNQRWEGVGPCGPRAVAVTNDFLFFIHRSGAYAYGGGEDKTLPMLLSQDLPVSNPNSIWNQINWDYEQTIWCCADEETKELRVGVPVGQSTVPNLTLTLNYREGIGGPIHFTSQDGNEKYLAGAHKWSIDSIAGNCAVKMERKLPTLGSPFGLQRQSQVLIASSSPDGTVQAVTQGVYNDNNSGIQAEYETACPSLNGISQLGGVMVNATGAGAMTVSVMVGGLFVTSPGMGNQGALPTGEVKLPDHHLVPEQWKAYDAGARGVQDEFFRLRFTNGSKADSYFGVKTAAMFTRPIFTGRSGSGS